MKKALGLIAAAALVLSVGAGTASAQVTATQNLTVTATVAARASLTLSVAAINFPDSDPTAVPSIPGSAAVGVTARARAGSANNVTVTALSDGNLVSGADFIPCGNVTWTAVGAGYVAGAVNNVTAQTVGAWVGSGLRIGTLDFALANSWDYAIGNYSMTVTFTLSAT